MNQRAWIKPEETLREKSHPSGRSSTGWLPLPTGHSAPHLTSQALKLTSGNGIKCSPRGILSPLLFLLTIPGEGSRHGMQEHWQAEEVLHPRRYITQFNLNQYPFFLVFIENMAIGCPISYQRSLCFRS